MSHSIPRGVYFLTGESRTYDRKAGALDRIKPHRNFITKGRCVVDGPGAWELASRWSHLDLNDNNVNGGRITDWTTGANWYMNPYTKLQFNYIHSWLDKPAFGKSNADIFITRAQVDF